MSSSVPLIDSFENELQALIAKYMDTGIALGEVISVLELTKLDLWSNSQSDEEDEKEEWEKE